MLISLTQLPPGKKGRIKEIELLGRIKHRILDLGFTPGATVETVRKSPLGDPIAFQIRGTIIALRAEESNQIKVALGGGYL